MKNGETVYFYPLNLMGVYDTDLGDGVHSIVIFDGTSRTVLTDKLLRLDELYNIMFPLDVNPGLSTLIHYFERIQTAWPEMVIDDNWVRLKSHYHRNKSELDKQTQKNGELVRQIKKLREEIVSLRNRIVHLNDKLRGVRQGKWTTKNET